MSPETLPPAIVLPAFLMFSLPPENWYRLLGWMVLGLVVYFSYGYRHSVLRQRNPAMDSSGAVVGAAGGARRL